MRFNVSAALGHAPDIADVHILGTDGTIRLRQPVGGALALSAGKRGKADLEPVEIDPAKRGAWRVKEEFVSTPSGARSALPSRTISDGGMRLDQEACW
jgi:hypothetical protein